VTEETKVNKPYQLNKIIRAGFKLLKKKATRKFPCRLSCFLSECTDTYPLDYIFGLSTVNIPKQVLIAKIKRFYEKTKNYFVFLRKL